MAQSAPATSVVIGRDRHLEGMREACVLRSKRKAHRVIDRVSESTDTSYEGECAVAQRIELGESAGLESRWYEQYVGTGDQSMRAGFIVADMHPDALWRALSCIPAGLLQRRLTAAEYHQCAAKLLQACYRA